MFFTLQAEHCHKYGNTSSWWSFKSVWRAIDIVTIFNFKEMFHFNCWINKFYSTILIFVFLYSEKRCHVLRVFNLFLHIACIMNGVTKKTKTHKAKSAESILIQQNHRSKNIIICQKISKQNSYTSLEIIFLKYIIFQKGR